MNNHDAVARAAEAMLRALGGAEVTLRCPTATANDPQARQLGLDAPVTEDLAVAPAIVRASGDDFELLLAPSSIARYIQDRGQSAEQFFAAVIAVLHAGRELRVRAFACDRVAGSTYLYRVTLTAKP